MIKSYKSKVKCTFLFPKEKLSFTNEFNGLVLGFPDCPSARKKMNHQTHTHTDTQAHTHTHTQAHIYGQL